MALNSFTTFNSSAGAQGATGSAPAPSNLCRKIPACYTSEIERWVLEASQWVNFAWDVSPEEERAFAQGKIPQNAFVPGLSPSVNSGPAIETGEAQTTVQRSPGHALDPDAIIKEIESSPLMHIDTSDIPLLYDSGAYASLPDPNVDAERYFEAFYSQPELVTSAFTAVTARMPPCIPAMTETGLDTLRSCMPTPALSTSSNSICSSEDSDWEMELLASAATNNVIPDACLGKKAFNFDDQFFAQPLPAGHPLPELFFPYAPQAQMAAPNVPVALSHGLPVAQDHLPQHVPMHGPSRTPASRFKRTAKPYSQRSEGSKTTERKSHNVGESSRPQDRELMCHVFTCRYKAKRWGDMRSFRRHLQTHPQYKTTEWWCRGIPRDDGQCCNRLFSRRDALVRHLNTVHECPDIAIEPVEIPHDADIFEEYGI